jgi:MFS family permease
MCLPNAVAILGITYPPGLRKNLIFAVFGAVAPGGAVIGAVFGGIFQDAWPWAFYSLALVLATAAVIASFIIPNREPTAHNKLSFSELIATLDILGGTVGIVALALFNFAWNQAPASSWADPAVIVTLILGILLVPAFFYIETRVSPSPLIPLDMVSRDIGFVIACVSCGWATFGIWIYYSWQFFQQIRGAGPLLTSAYYVPAAISGALASIITGFLLKFLHPAWVMCLSLTSFTIAPILVSTAPVEQTYWAQTFVSMIFITWGIDMSFPAATIIMSNAVKPEHQGIAASLIMT